jgi:hypothetical protein
MRRLDGCFKKYSSKHRANAFFRLRFARPLQMLGFSRLALRPHFAMFQLWETFTEEA